MSLLDLFRPRPAPAAPTTPRPSIAPAPVAPAEPARTWTGPSSPLLDRVFPPAQCTHHPEQAIPKETP